MARDTRNTLKEGMKNGNYKKSLTTAIKFFSFIVSIWKRIYFARKHSLGKCSLYYYISSNLF